MQFYRNTFQILVIKLLILGGTNICAVSLDARISYTPLSETAKSTGQLEKKYDVSAGTTVLSKGLYKLVANVPRKASAYDVIPIQYTLEQPLENARWAVVEVVAFEDESKLKNQSLYDLSVPGNLNVKIEYLGSISADYTPNMNVPLTPSGNSKISAFPPCKRDTLVRSGLVRAAPLVWFKFRVTNTGDTILDPEGLSGSFAMPIIHRIKEDGGTEWTSRVSNYFLRHLNYLYPGDSVELWANFACLGHFKNAQWSWGLEPGRYRIDFRMAARFYDHYDWLTNIWGGTEFARLEVPFEVTEKGGTKPVSTHLVNHADQRIPTVFERFEEFMTSFVTYPPEFSPAPKKDTIYLQIAPWTTHITVKLILSNPMEIITSRVPIETDNQNLAIQYNPDNVMVLEKNGIEEPVVAAQLMPGMRTGLVFGPFPERHMYERLKEAKELGINVLINTSGDWHIHEMLDRPEPYPHAVSYKYFYDVLVDKLDMTLMGWSIYPPVNPKWYQAAEKLLNKSLKYETTGLGYNNLYQTVDMADPVVPEVIAAWTEFNYKRWGKHWFKTKDGRIPVDVEDTWGWMRDDVNCRYLLGKKSIEQFRQWVRNKYGTIEKVNQAWCSNYTDFSQIDPQANQGEEGDNLNTAGPVYNKPENPFHDFSAALEDFDVFRTLLKCQIYKKTNELIKKQIPKAEIALRSEGATPIAAGCRDCNDLHQRYIYYSQRRNANVYDVLKEQKVIRFYSDYTTLPYPLPKWKMLMEGMVKDGIVPGFLLQFDRMRDIFPNKFYGRNWQRNLNLKYPQKTMQVYSLVAAYPWWKATYQAGGMCGILWEDYLCDGFATETQKRELKLLRNYFSKMEQ